MHRDITTPEPSPSTAAAPLLQARALHRYLGQGEGRSHVLRGADITLYGGESCAIVGPSGCGKSTLLYLLGLLDRADSGEIFIHGELLGDASDALRTQARNRHIGFVFQFHYLLPEFTALENVMLPMDKLGKLTAAQRHARALELLDSVGLAQKASRLAVNLSGGEQQRVAVARALANAPSLILADEPTGNLDSSNSERVFSLLRESARTHGHAVLMVTHNADLAAQADRCLRMEDGLFKALG